MLKSIFQLAHQLDLDEVVKEGIYTMVGGPNYETVAELKLLSLLGVDSVGKELAYWKIIINIF